MADIQRTIDEIRFFLQAEDLEITEQVRELASDYATICKETNRRLRRCDEYLKQGLLSEAIHLADAEPKLLDVVAVLDFSERVQWEEVLGIYQIPKGEPLQLETATQLNEVYAAQKPLEKLLNRHRLLALARAPLKERLAVLRELAPCDPVSPFWEEDVKIFEQARTSEIEGEARKAAARQDAVSLKSLRAELEASNWTELPSKALVQSVRKLADETSRRVARASLEQLEPELNAAFSALDAEKGTELRDRWVTLAGQARLPQSDHLLERVSPVLGWLADLDSQKSVELAFQDALGALERTLNEDDASHEEIERAGHAALKCNLPLPGPLASRYENRIKAINTAGRRRHQVVVGSIVACAAVAVILVGVLIRNGLQSTEVKRIAERTQQLVIDREFSEARSLLDANSRLSSWQSWIEADRALSDAEKREQNRQRTFRQVVDQAKSAKDWSVADSSIQLAHAVAMTDADKSEIASVEKHWKAVKMKAAAEAESQFRDKLAALTADLNQLDQLNRSPASSAEFDKIFRRAERTHAELNSATTSVDSVVATESTLLTTRLAKIKAEFDEQQKRSEMLEELTRLASVATEPQKAVVAYVDVLKTYSSQFKKEVRSAHFQEVLQEAAHWQSIASWQELVDKWRDFDPVDLPTVKRRLDECQTWLKVNPNSPAASIARTYLSYLQSMRLREEDASGGRDSCLRAKLLRLFSAPLIDGVYYLETEAGDRYYFSEQQDYSQQHTPTTSFRYIVEFSGKTKPITLRANIFKSDKTRVAPQSEIAKSVRKQLPDIQLHKWDGYIQDLAGSIFSDKRFDPFLRYYLVIKTLENAGDGNFFVKQELESIISKLRDDKIDLAARWMDPRDQEATLSRNRAIRALELVANSEISEVWHRAALKKSKFTRALGSHKSIVGWLMRDANQWRCRTNWKSTSNHVLYIATSLDWVRGQANWTVVGNLDSTKGLALDISQAQAFKEGRLVFAGPPYEAAP